MPPTWRFGELGGGLSGEVGAALEGIRYAGVHAGAGIAAGARHGRGQTTLYMRGRLESGANVWAPQGQAGVVGPGGQVMVELTTEGDEVREVAFRTATHGAGGRQVIDTVARLDLRDPAQPGGGPVRPRERGADPAAAAALMRYTVQHGTVERAVYDVRDSSSSFALAVKLVRRSSGSRTRTSTSSAGWSPPARGRTVRKSACARTASRNRWTPAGYIVTSHTIRRST